VSGPGHDKVTEAYCRGAEWLATMQESDGSLGVTRGLAGVGWATPYAILLWNLLRLHTDKRERAVQWLLRLRGQNPPPDSPSRIVVGHDFSLVGWPWTAGTHSWVEPTALAVLALSGEGLKDEQRVREGYRLIVDRALPHGGWNYGNKSVFGRELRPHPGPTGLALLALATRGSQVRPSVVDPAIEYLTSTLPELLSPISLGFGLLGLRAWHAAPADSAGWLRRAHARHAGRLDAACGLGLLLLAAVEHGPAMLGVRAGESGQAEASHYPTDKEETGDSGR
jgi:hypothetical protein